MRRGRDKAVGDEAGKKKRRGKDEAGSDEAGKR